jgi:hypothetical protein
MNSCIRDPGWFYMLHQPSLDIIEQKDGYRYKYIYRSDSLNIKLTAEDFALETWVELNISTTLDSIIIYPNFSYITSPHFINKKHVPISIIIKYFSRDSLILNNCYAISVTKGGWPSEVVSLEKWQANSIIIDNCTKRKKISKDEFLAPYCLNNGDSLIIYFTYPGFARYVKHNLIPEKSDFIFQYDIYNKNNPLTFHFKPATYEPNNK